MINFKVTEIINYIKKITSTDYILTKLSVEGEISNFKIKNGGNLYFSMKDENSKINCIMYRWNIPDNINEFKDGSLVVCTGSITIYEKDGAITFNVEKIEQLGTGKLYEKFEKLKKELSEKGYFNEEHKKALPLFPKKIGILTSDTGAAIRDIITVLKRRNEYVDILLYPAVVQGKYSAKTLIEGLKYFENTDIDLLIMGRGGGSYEDLNSFNDYDLAISMYNFNKPIISAVGHEIDFVITDFVADKRAATPSVAAEIAVPKISEIKLDFEQKLNRISTICERRIFLNEKELSDLKTKIDSNSPENYLSLSEINLETKVNTIKKCVENKIELNEIKLEITKNKIKSIRIEEKISKNQNNIENILTKIDEKLKLSLENKTKKLLGIKSEIESLDINKMFERGYSIATDENGKVIKSVSNIQNGEILKISVSDGQIISKVLDRSKR